MESPDANGLIRIHAPTGQDEQKVPDPTAPRQSMPGPLNPGPLNEEMIWSELSTIYDPEIPVNIVDLGLIYSARIVPLEQGGNRIEVEMTLTAPGCGMASVLKATAEHKLSQLPDTTEVRVDIVFDPPWHQGLMSEAAKLQLGL